MLEITHTEYLDILFDNSITKCVVEKVQKTSEINTTTLVVNNVERAIRIITCDGVNYFKLR